MTAPPPGAESREAARAAFLAAAGWKAARCAPLAGDASNRSYLRLKGPLGGAVLMDAPPERGEDVRPFLAVSDLLSARGLSAPRVLAADPQAGLVLLEDLGDALYARVCAADPGAEDLLYGAATDLLAQALDPLPRDVLAPYDDAVLLRESRLALDWYLGGLGGPARPDAIAAFDALILRALAPALEGPRVLVLRDYHAENLLWLPERRGHARVGLLDYQDALAGHPAYDLVSLLEDARRDTAPALRAAMLARYLAARPDIEPEGFRAAFAALGAQRNLKILGIFARLALRDGKPRYLALMPRVWGHLSGDLAHPALAGLRGWVMRHLPPPNADALAQLEAGTGRRVAAP